MLSISPQNTATGFETQRIAKDSLIRLTQVSTLCFTGLRNESVLTAIRKNPVHYGSYVSNSVGKYLALHNGAVLTSTVLRLSINCGFANNNVLCNIDAHIDSLPDRMKALFARLEHKVELIPQSTTYINFENLVCSGFKRIDNILALDKEQDAERIIDEITKLFEHVKTLSLQLFDSESHLFDELITLSRDVFYDDVSMQAMVISLLYYQCSTSWMKELIAELLVIKANEQEQIQSLRIKKIYDKSITDSYFHDIKTRTVERLLAEIHKQIRLYQGYFKSLEHASVEAILNNDRKNNIVITCTGLPSYFKSHFLLAERLSLYTHELCKAQFSKDDGLMGFIRHNNLVQNIAPTPQGTAKFITQLTDRYPNYEFFIVISPLNNRNTSFFKLGKKYTSCQFKNVAIGNSKKHVCILAIHKHSLHNYHVRYANWENEKRELHQKTIAHDAYSRLLGRLIEQDPNYHEDFSIGYGLTAGSLNNYLGLIVTDKNGEISYESEVIKTMPITNQGVSSQLYPTNSCFYFSVSAGLKVTTGALVKVSSTGNRVDTPCIHVYPITEHTYASS